MPQYIIHNATAAAIEQRRFDWAKFDNGRLIIEANDKYQAAERYAMMDKKHSRAIHIRKRGEAITGEALEALNQAVPNFDLSIGRVYPISGANTNLDAHNSRVTRRFLEDIATDINERTGQFLHEHNPSEKLGRVVHGRVNEISGGHELVMYLQVLDEVVMPGQPKLSVQKAIETGFIEHFSNSWIGGKLTEQRDEAGNTFLQFDSETTDNPWDRARFAEISAVATPSNPNTNRRSSDSIQITEIKISRNMNISKEVTIGDEKYTISASVENEALQVSGLEEAAEAINKRMAELKETTEALQAKIDEVAQPFINDVVTMSKELAKSGRSIEFTEDEVKSWSFEQVQKRAADLKKIYAQGAQHTMEAVEGDQPTGSHPWKLKTETTK